MAKKEKEEVQAPESLPKGATSMIGVRGEMAVSNYFDQERRIDDLRLNDYRRMRQNDGQVAMILSAIINSILSPGVDILDDEDIEGEEDSEELQFIKQNLLNPRWKDGMSRQMDVINREMLRALEEGFIIQEVVYRKDPDGKFRLDKLVPRISRLSDLEVQVVVDDNGNYLGFHQVTSFMAKSVDVIVLNNSEISKSVNIVWGEEYGSNYGRPLLKPIWYHYDKLHKLLYILHVGTELGAVKYRQVKELVNTTDTKRTAMMDSARKVGLEAVIQYNANEFEMIFEDVSSADVMAQGMGLAEYHTAQMSKVALAQFIDLGSKITGTGARSLGEDQIKFFKLGLQSIAHTLIEQPWNKLISDLIKVNFNRGIYPTLKVKPISDEAAQTIFDVFMELSKKGSLTPGLEAELMKQASERLHLDVTPEEIDKQVEEQQQKEVEEKQAEQDMMKQKFEATAKVASQPAAQKPKVVLEDTHSDTVMEYMNTSSVLPRELYPDERKVRLVDIKFRLDTTTERAKVALNNRLQVQKQAIIDQYIRAAREGRKAVKKVNIQLAEDTYSEELAFIAGDIAEFGKSMAANELGKEIPSSSKQDKEYIEDTVGNVISEQEARLALRLSGVALLALRNSMPENEMRLLLENEYTDFFDKVVTPTVGVVVPDMFNYGRKITFDRYSEIIFAYRYTAVLDNRTTQYCRSMDGRVFQSNDPEFAMVTPPNHFGCRSIWTPITYDEEKEFNTVVDGLPAGLPVFASVSAFKDLGLVETQRSIESEAEQELTKLIESLDHEQDHRSI